MIDVEQLRKKVQAQALQERLGSNEDPIHLIIQRFALSRPEHEEDKRILTNGIELLKSAPFCWDKFLTNAIGKNGLVSKDHIFEKQRTTCQNMKVQQGGLLVPILSKVIDDMPPSTQLISEALLKLGIIQGETYPLASHLKDSISLPGKREWLLNDANTHTTVHFVSVPTIILGVSAEFYLYETWTQPTRRIQDFLTLQFTPGAAMRAVKAWQTKNPR